MSSDVVPPVDASASAPPIVARAPGLDDRFGRLEIVFWLLAIAPLLVLPDYLVLASQVLIAALFALSLDLILGYAGIVSLGHAAFFGVGAYVAGLLSVRGHAEPLSGLVVAALASGVVGFCTSFLVVGGHGLTRLMVTLAVGLSLHEAANQASSVTGGTDGLSGMETSDLLSLLPFDMLGKTAYLYVLGVCFVVFLLVRRLVHSPFGLSLRGIRENERRMHALGAPVQRRLIEVYTLAAALAGVAGALSAQTTEFVGLETLGFDRSAGALVMLVLGGAGRLYGAFVGSCLFMLLQSVFSDIHPAYWQFWMGCLVMLIAFFARGGILGYASDMLMRLRERRALSAAAPAARTRA
ncbi:MAG TPA: branched-chain amino acid ABC transporter permease [Polyangiaceae bacterium]|nr:branched-chain amino acid ABC transporter permease [Polyangiaceae bacterium]